MSWHFLSNFVLNPLSSSTVASLCWIQTETEWVLSAESALAVGVCVWILTVPHATDYSPIVHSRRVVVVGRHVVRSQAWQKQTPEGKKKNRDREVVIREHLTLCCPSDATLDMAWSFSNLQQSSLGEHVPTVASDASSWLTGVKVRCPVCFEMLFCYRTKFVQRKTVKMKEKNSFYQQITIKV